MTGRDEAYDELIESTARAYAPKIVEHLKSVIVACRERGLATDDEPFDLTDDDYRWAVHVWRTPKPSGDENLIDVTIEISEEREYDNETGHGLNFGLDVVEWGGRILGVWQPYNYTPLCWVDAREPHEVAERWSLFASADVSGIPDLILEDQG